MWNVTGAKTVNGTATYCPFCPILGWYWVKEMEGLATSEDGEASISDPRSFTPFVQFVTAEVLLLASFT